MGRVEKPASFLVIFRQHASMLRSRPMLDMEDSNELQPTVAKTSGILAQAKQTRTRSGCLVCRRRRRKCVVSVNAMPS